MTSVSLQELIDNLDRVGWKKGYEDLKKEHEKDELRYVSLCLDPDQYSYATGQLGKKIAMQSETLLRLKVFAKECRGIELG